MAKNAYTKIFIVMVYIIIIIMIPLFLDQLFRITTRRKRKLTILDLAKKKAKDTNKPLLIFNGKTNGVISISGDLKDKEPIDGDSDITEIIPLLKDNSFVIVISETLEYIDDINELIKNLRTVSGSDLYIINLEKNSPRIFYDYNIKNIIDEPFYIFSEDNFVKPTEIKWTLPSNLQKQTQKFYSYIFKILPYNFFTSDKIEEIQTKN